MSLKNLLTNPQDFKYTYNSRKGVTDTYQPYTEKGYPTGGAGNNFKNLKYSGDSPGGGNSPFLNKFNKQDWVKNPIPAFPAQDIPGLGLDQLVRGGTALKTAVPRDINRMTRFLSSENGIVFLAKQFGLYVAEQIQLYGPDQTKWKVTYNPTSPLVNTTLAPTGLHLANVILSNGGPSGVNQGAGYLYGQPNLLIPRETRSQYGEGKTYLQKPKDFGNEQNIKDRVDKITTAALYRDLTAKSDLVKADTVPFYITVINNDGSGNNTYIHFRSYIEGLADSFGADWGTQKYMGRGENFYFYNGFSRDISFTFKVPVLSAFEQRSVYSKLNYLASIMAPDYSNGGFMRGNLIKLTIGDYLKDVPGVLTSLNYTINNDAGWDIGSEDNKSNNNTGGWVMPKLIEISGFNFKPIHSFIPKTVNPDYITTGNGGFVDAPFINYGKLNSDTNNGGGYGGGVIKIKEKPNPQTPITQNQDLTGGATPL